MVRDDLVAATSLETVILQLMKMARCRAPLRRLLERRAAPTGVRFRALSGERI